MVFPFYKFLIAGILNLNRDFPLVSHRPQRTNSRVNSLFFILDFFQWFWALSFCEGIFNFPRTLRLINKSHISSGFVLDIGLELQIVALFILRILNTIPYWVLDRLCFLVGSAVSIRKVGLLFGLFHSFHTELQIRCLDSFIFSALCLQIILQGVSLSRRQAI